MTKVRHKVYLIPGFFGFSDIGGITYFHHVREQLHENLLDLGIESDIYAVRTHPTASIRKRAAKLLRQVADTAGEDGPIHLVGHSTGGLDARLFVTPGASLPLEGPEVDLEGLAGRVQNVITVSAPHQGTPMAAFFTSLIGARLLHLLSLGTIYTLRFGKFPMTAAFMLMGILSRLDDLIGLENTIFDQVYDSLLRDFDDEKRTAIRRYLEDIRTDQSLVLQLTPGGVDLFNASTKDRPGVRYASVVMQAQKPRIRSMGEIGLDPYRQASHVLYRGLYWLSSRNPDFVRPTREQSEALESGFGELPSARANDGIVPTLSQVYGDIIHTDWGDHLDTCGHFNDPTHNPPHIDWISTGSGFVRQNFETLWGKVAERIAEKV